MSNKGNPTLPIPVDFIDLTEDSPINLSRRENKNAPNLNNSTRRFLRNRAGFIPDLNTAEDLSIKPSASVAVLEDIINLDDTLSSSAVLEDIINLDDTLSSSISVPGVASEKSVEKALPTLCPICLEDLSSALKPMSTRCGHIYCSDCLQATIKAKKRCPKCQCSITEKTCIRLYF